jgi:uncharacterized OB-fold protein
MQLLVQRCRQCRQLFTTPRYICKNCGSTVFETINLSGRGHIYSYTIIHEPPEGLINHVPYTIIVVELDCSPQTLRIFGRLTRAKESGLQIGTPVALKKIDEWGYWFGIST